MPQRGLPIGTQIWLRDNYPEIGPTKCAEILGIPFTIKGVRQWAFRNGVKWIRSGKPKAGQSDHMKRLRAEGKVVSPAKGSDASLAAGKKRAKMLADGVIQHPRGMLGKNHSDDFKAKQSARMKARADAGIHVFQQPRTQEQRDAVAKRNIARIGNGSTGNIYSSAKRGYRDDMPGVFFRSRWEANYARFLTFLASQGKIARWEFEKDTFWFESIRRGVRSYTPDFKVWLSDGSYYYDEVKGWMDPKSKTKLKRMAKYYPAVKINVIDGKAYREIEKKIGGAIPHWEKG